MIGQLLMKAAGKETSFLGFETKTNLSEADWIAGKQALLELNHHR